MDHNNSFTKPTFNYIEYPLSHNQRALWFMQRVNPDSVAYNVAYAVRICDGLDVPALRQAFQVLTDRHSSLRTTFSMREGEPVQRVYDRVEVCFQVKDASSWSEAQLDERLKKEVYRPFDLEKGPLMRNHLFSLPTGNHLFLLVMHHIIIDMWSLGLAMLEAPQLHAQIAGGEQPSATPLCTTYADYVAREAEMLEGPEGERLWAYWKEQLGDTVPVLELLTDRPRPPLQTDRGGLESIWLGPELTQALKSASREMGATRLSVMLAAFQTLLHRYTGQTNILLGFPRDRRRDEIMQVIGYFVNSVVIRGDLSGDPTFVDFLSQVHQTIQGAFEHDAMPLSLLAERLRLERDLSHAPLFQVMFAWQKVSSPIDPRRLSSFALSKDQGGGLNLWGLEFESATLRHRPTPFDLTFLVAETEDGLGVTMEYNSDLFNAATIRRMLGHYRNLLDAIIVDPKRRVSELPLLMEAERHQLLVEWNATTAGFPHTCVHELFEAQVERTPNALAVAYMDGQQKKRPADQPARQLSYQQLNQRANQLAHCLQKLGVGPEVLVGICVERSLDMVVGLLGILKAGGAYLPLDPTYPQERLALMMQDARASVLVTQEPLAARLPISNLQSPTSALQIVRLDADWAAINRESEQNLGSGVTPGNLAYVIYTSGSTGRPKGVLLAHKGLCNLVQAQTEAFGVTGDSRVLQFASFSFDAAVSEIFMALLKGATLCLTAQETLASVADLGQLLSDLAITTVTMPPSVLSVLPVDELPALRTVISAGETCSPQVAARWSPGRRFFNAYGPTEATIGPLLYPLQDPLDGMINVPIGHPITNTQIYLLDAHQQPVPVGVPGELHVGGVGVARGYLNQPELTAQKFVPSPPFASPPGGGMEGGSGARLYKTGDLARYRPDGNIEFLGRLDFQVKVRGFRIELGEIEAALRQHQALQAAVVLAREDAPGDGETRLVAYVVPQGETAPTVSELRSFLGEKLAEYMLPSTFVTLEALPLMSNGKVDRKALPAPTSDRPELETAYVMPQNEVQRTIASIWQQVLGVDKVGIHDNFFDLGGHSLLVAKIHSQLQEAFQRQLAMVELFRYPTVSALAAYLSRESDEQAFVQRGLERADKQKEAMKRQQQRMSAIASRQKAARRRR